MIASANALRLGNPADPAEWLRLNGQQPWLEVVFGAVGESDLRNAFQSVFPLDPSGWFVREYQYDLDKDWGNVAQAARNLKTSESSIPVSAGSGSMPGASPVQIGGDEAALRGSLADVTTLLASVGRCSRPERIHPEIRCFATTRLASVERCSRRSTQ